MIVPTLNEAAPIGDLLQRLPATPKVYEVIVSDGGSTDGTVGLVAPQARLVVGEPGHGPQLRRGTVTGDVLLFLHADVLPPEDVAARVSGASLPESAPALRPGRRKRCGYRSQVV